MAYNISNRGEVQQEYAAIRFRNRQLLNERIREVRRQVPRIAEIDGELRDMTIDAALSHEEPQDPERLAARSQTLIQEKRRLLCEAGYPADYLSPIFSCEQCRDTGYIGNEPCDCLKKRLITRQYEQANLDRRSEAETFDAFRADYYSDQPDGVHSLTPRENIENIYRSLHAYIANLSAYFQGDDSQKANLLFQGGTGVGKSFLSNCVARELLNQGYAVLYASAGPMFEQLGDVVMNQYRLPDSASFYQAVTDCDVLIIDDLGTEFANSFTTSYLYTLINDRLLRRKATVISTNLSLTDLRQRYSERIFSRVCDSYLIYNIYGEDIRFARRKSWQGS